MGFSLTALADESRVVSVNFWNWRPTVQILYRLDLIDSERAEDLQTQCLGATVDEQEARAFAAAIRDKVLPQIPDEGRVALDGSIVVEPDDGTLHRGKDVHKNYGAQRGWLVKFVDFCLSCGGFVVH